jgi:hypothetical protein
MLASHTILRPVTPGSTRIFLRYGLLNNNSLLRSRVSPVHKFHSNTFLNATHRTTSHWRPLGPFQRFTRRLNAIPPNYIIFGILGINGVVFAAWSYVQLFQVTSAPSSRAFAAHSAQGAAYRFSKPPPSAKWLAYWLRDNFINSYENLRRGRLYVQSATALPNCPDVLFRNQA